MPIERTCLFCGKTFYAKPYRIKLGRAKYCSYKCVHNDKRRSLAIRCEYCGIEFRVWPSRLKVNQGKYCSRNCMYKAQSGKGNPNWKGGQHVLKCLQCGKEYEEDGCTADKRRFCSNTCFSKWREINLRGKNNPNWRDGITTKNQIIRTSKEYKDWKTAVFKRDNYTCQFCGVRGGKLNAHHILSFKDYPEYRFNVDNGITHCKECHNIISSISNSGDIFQPLPRFNTSNNGIRPGL